MNGEFPRPERGLAGRPDVWYRYGVRIRPLIIDGNENPGPPVRHRTSDEILERLAAYCERLPNS